jgi:hypothetical protein
MLYLSSVSLLKRLEDLRELKSYPAEIGGWNNKWLEAHSVFVYEAAINEETEE